MRKKSRALIHSPPAIIGGLLILFWVSVAILAPVLAPPQDPDNAYMMVRHGFSSLPKPADAVSLWGTTSGGYDIFYGIIWGSRTSLVLGLVTVLSSAAIGTLSGGICAYYGGILDEICMRIVDLFMGIPFLIAVIVMTTVWGKGMDKIIIALIVFGWHRYARMMRGEVLRIKEMEYVLAAKHMGASPMGIFFKHILPNTISPIIILMSINTGRMVLVAASLSFVGVGAEPGFADWGQMLNFSRDWISGIPGHPFCYWYTYVYASIAIFTFVLGWTLLGDALSDIHKRQDLN